MYCTVQGESSRKLVQGSYCIVETLVPSQELYTDGEQLVVLLGFRYISISTIVLVEVNISIYC